MKIFKSLVLTLPFPNAPLFLPLFILDTFLLDPFPNSSDLSSDEHLLNFDLTTDQISTPSTPNRVNYPLIVNNALVASPPQDPQFLTDSPLINRIQILKFPTKVVVKKFIDYILQTLKLNLKALLIS